LRRDNGHLTSNNGKIFCKDGGERFMRDVRAYIEMNQRWIYCGLQETGIRGY